MDLEPSNLEIEFEEGGRLECWGMLTTGPEAEYVGADEQGIVEQTPEVEITVLESGRTYTPEDGWNDLEPGLYTVGHNGLQRVGEAA